MRLSCLCPSAMPENELHKACIDQDWERAMALALAESESGLLREKGPYGYLPLHSAVCCGPPLRLVVAMVVAYPEALAFKSDGGRTPLALAQQSSQKQQPGVLEVLQGHDLATCKAAERKDWAPLQAFQRRYGEAPAAWVVTLAQDLGAPPATVDELCERLGLAELVEAALWAPLTKRAETLVTRAACVARDAAGKYPVDVTVELGAPPELVLKMRATGGLTVAVARKDWEIIEELQMITPEACAMPDAVGTCPLALAITGPAPAEVLSALREASSGCAEALAQALRRAVEEKQWEALMRLQLITREACALPDSTKMVPKPGAETGVAAMKGVFAAVDGRFGEVVQQRGNTIRLKWLDDGSTSGWIKVDKLTSVVASMDDLVRIPAGRFPLELAIASTKMVLKPGAETGVAAKKGVFAAVDGQFGEVAMDPNSDKNIRLKWMDGGSKSGYIKVDQLTSVVASRDDLMAIRAPADVLSKLREASSECAEALAQAFQQAVEEKQWELLPLLWPMPTEACTTANADGDLALHVAVKSGAGKETVTILVKEYKEAVGELGKEDKSTLELAVTLPDVSMEVLQVMLDYFPEACKVPNADEDLPIHVVLAAPRSTKMVLKPGAVTGVAVKKGVFAAVDGRFGETTGSPSHLNAIKLQWLDDGSTSAYIKVDTLSSAVASKDDLELSGKELEMQIARLERLYNAQPTTLDAKDKGGRSARVIATAHTSEEIQKWVKACGALLGRYRPNRTVCAQECHLPRTHRAG